MKQKEWRLKERPDAAIVKLLSSSLGLNTDLATLLALRGVSTFEEAKAFFRPSLDDLHDPFLMKDMDKAVERIATAWGNGEKILVYGDYDVDGTTSVALLYSFLREKGEVGFYIPDRYGEGYGLSEKGVRYAKENGYSLIITLDCGIRAEAAAPNVLGYANDGQDDDHQTTYDLAMAVDPSSVGTIYTAGINLWKSTSFGDAGTMTNVTQWRDDLPSTTSYCHADIHNVDFSPVDGSLYVCSDGGLYRSTNSGTSFTKLSSGMCTMQFYDIADYEGNSNHLIGGTQDNGTNYRNTSTTTWNHIEGADGSDAMIDHTTPSTLYLTMNSSLLKSTNSGASVTDISPAYTGWANLEMSASNSSIIYAGYSEIYRSTNGGSSWTNITSSSSASGSRKLKLGVNNTSRLYATNGTSIWMSSDAQAATPTWTDITAGLSGSIADIAVHPSASNYLAVCMSGFSDGNKVFLSLNAGTSWTNITGSLPNIPFNCIEFENTGDYDDRRLYLGGDVGVYYTDNSIGDWIPFRNGLPHTPVYDLEINEASGLLRAATHGRGVWQTAIYTACAASYSLTDGNLPGSGSQGYRYYQSSGTITSSRTIDGGIGTDVTYQAASEVNLINGFEVVANSKFRAFNAPCSTLPVEYMAGQELTGIYAGPMPGVVEEVVGIEEYKDQGDYLMIYPNPTAGITNIEFKLEEASVVSLSIMDISGRELISIVQQKELQAGSYKIAEDLGGLSSGFYVCRIMRGETISTARIAVTD